ncbi:MAG TPA: hypothetical protein VK447_13845 [Myxococcaceae bacterium]|nr:hypothetical protein [Myxococcaceae bacterium]
MPGRVWKLSLSNRPDKGAAIPPKIGGEPDVLGPLEWPSCGQCGKPMRYLFQLPHLVQRLELAPYSSVHVFRCENNETVCDSFRADSGANRAVGIIAGKPGVTGAPPDRIPYPEQFLELEEAEEDTAALDIDKDTVSFAALGEYDRAAKEAPRSKLGGVPIWPQSDATPTCCGERMRFLAQLHGDTFGVPFGDDGTGFLFGCRKQADHPFKFLWEGF